MASYNIGNQYKWKWQGNGISTINRAALPIHQYPNPNPAFNPIMYAQHVNHFLDKNLNLYTNNGSTFKKYKISFKIEQIRNENTYAQNYGNGSNYGNLIDNGLASLEVYLSTPINTALPTGFPQYQSKRIDIMTITDATTTSSDLSAWGTFETEITLDNYHAYAGPGATGMENSIVFASLVGEGVVDEVGLQRTINPLDPDVPNLVNWQGKISMVSVEEVATDDDGEYSDETATARVELEINSIESTPPTVSPNTTELRYKIDLYDKEEKLFEFKFPRFSYRYKYIDGEYSGFAPFSKVAFVPGGFDYHPKKGYNLGMTNTLKNLTLDGYASGAPADVASIDILYKEEDSPNIYIVDTLKEFGNQQYKIESETLKNGITQSNQLLRHWDNVPITAKSQEIIGNRLVYGNYLQNYDLLETNTLDPDSTTITEFAAALNPKVISKKLTAGAEGAQSIKSLREYQVGIVYADKYGRQTPVLTNSGATFRVNKNKAESQNSLIVSIGNEGHPVNMEYFKFYIKDNTSEYYNLAMDRYYDGEDENIWISFPSSDRNKVEVEDFLILKKGADSTSLIKETARYKIIDIKNEAPENIKRTEYLIGTKRHSNTTPTADFNVFLASDLPFVGDDTFTVNYERLKSSSFANLHNDFNSRPSDKYYITLSNDATKKVSDRYEVISLAADDDVTTNEWYFHLKYAFGEEINDFTDDPTGKNSTKIIDDTYLNIYKSTVDDSLKFDGRFFVKIFNDKVFTRNIIEAIDSTKNITYKAIPDSARKIYGLETDGQTDRIKKHFNPATSEPTVFEGCRADTTSAPQDLSVNVIKPTDRSMTSWRSYIEATNKFGYHVGTLHDNGSFGGNGVDPVGFEGSRWQQYDAYFRGFNVDPDGIDQRVERMDIHGNDAESQSFEDVWFFDKGSTAGQFENSNNSPASGWDSLPNTGNGIGIGIKNDFDAGQNTTGSFIELGFGGIQPNEWQNNVEGDPTSQGKPSGIHQYLHHSDSSFYDLSTTNLNYSKTQQAFIKNLSVGSQFRFKEDPLGEVYTILDVDIKFKIRYEDIGTGLIRENAFTKNFDYATSSSVGYLTGDFVTVKQISCYPLQVLGKKGFGVRTPYYKGTGDPMNPANTLQLMHGLGTAKASVVNATEDHDASNAAGNNGRHGYYKTSSFLRASNFTKNWRLRLDKKLTWNPYQSTETEITGGQTIELTPKSGSVHGTNFIVVDSVARTVGSGPTQKNRSVGTSYRKADPTSPNNVFEVRKVEVGMVIETAPNGDPIPVDKLPVVSAIEKLGSNTTKFYFKNYKGGNDLTGGGATGDLSTNGTTAIVFKQFPVNGLSPNSAKNLNYFNGSTGNVDATDPTGASIGTDAVGYTMEFIEEMTQRPDEVIVPQNPAIFETEPKKLETDLDIYHAISDFHSIKIDSVTDFIPIGSMIEHRNSSTIPYNTKIDSIDKSGNVVLSRMVIVEVPNNVSAGPGLNDGSSNWGYHEKN